MPIVSTSVESSLSWFLNTLQLIILDPFLSNLLGTLIGVFVAFVLASEYDSRKKLTSERETKKRVISTIEAELSANQTDLRDAEKVGGVKIWVFRTSGYESAINTGGLSLLSVDLQIQLSYLYMNFRMVETAAAKIVTMLGTETAFQNWSKYQPEVEAILREREGFLKRDIPTALDALGHEKNQPPIRRGILGTLRHWTRTVTPVSEVRTPPHLGQASSFTFRRVFCKQKIEFFRS